MNAIFYPLFLNSYESISPWEEQYPRYSEELLDLIQRTEVLVKEITFSCKMIIIHSKRKNASQYEDTKIKLQTSCFDILMHIEKISSLNQGT